MSDNVLLQKAPRSLIKRLAIIAILGALAFILMYIEFPLPFIAPPYYKFDFSEVAVLIVGFALGPMSAIAMEALKIGLELVFRGTTTAFVGEIANFLIGISFVLPATWIYLHKKTKVVAFFGLVLGTITMSVVGVLLNYFLLLPAYAYFFHMPIETIVQAGKAIFPFVNSAFDFVLFNVLPFNLIKGVLVSIVTILLYKSISPLLHR